MSILTFLALLFAHLVADYPLQGDFLAKMKGENKILLASHAGIWTGCITIGAYFIGLDINLLDVSLLFVIHMLADYLKATNKLWYKKVSPLKGGLASDQLIHVGQILLLLAMNI